MKGKQSKVLVTGLVFAMLLSSLTPIMDVSARKETNSISDSFDQADKVGSFNSDIWTLYGKEDAIKIAELSKPEKVLKCEAKNITGETNVLMSKDWYWEIHSLTFDMWIPAGANWSYWAFLDFVDIDEPMDYVGDNGEYGTPMCYGAMKIMEEDDFDLGHTDWKHWGFSSNKIGDTWIRVKIVTQSANQGKIMIASKGEAFDEAKAQPITLAGDRSFYNSNIVFGDYQFHGYMLDNIVIETDTGTYKEDFEDGKNDLFEEISITERDETSFPVIDYLGSRKLAFSNTAEKDRVIANTKLEQNDEHLKASDKVIETSFTVDYKTNKTNEEIAYVFGLAENDSDPFADTWAVIFEKNNARISYFTSEGEEKVCAKKSFGSSLSGNKVTMELTKDGTLTVMLDGKSILKHKGVETYAGYTGFAAKTDISKTIYIDDITIVNNVFDVITTKSFADDFSENKLGTSGNSDYAWNAESGSIDVGDGELIFDGCSDYTFLGPAYEYETYELSFQLTSILGTDDEKESMNATYKDRWLGIDFGKATGNINTYGTYCMLATVIRPPADGSEWKQAGNFIYKTDSSRLEQEVMTVVQPIPTSFFENITYDGKNKVREDISADDAVCFKFVALENRVELYLKRASDENYTLYVTVDNVDPKGYVGIACTGYTYWTIDNFNIKNTAEIYNEAPPVVIEEIVLPTLAERGVGVKDTYWAAEQKLNEESSGVSPIVWIAGGSTVAVVGVLAVVLVQVKKKKKTMES